MHWTHNVLKYKAVDALFLFLPSNTHGLGIRHNRRTDTIGFRLVKSQIGNSAFLRGVLQIFDPTLIPGRWYNVHTLCNIGRKIIQKHWRIFTDDFQRIPSAIFFAFPQFQFEWYSDWGNAVLWYGGFVWQRKPGVNWGQKSPINILPISSKQSPLGRLGIHFSLFPPNYPSSRILQIIDLTFNNRQWIGHWNPVIRKGFFCQSIVVWERSWKQLDN